MTVIQPNSITGINSITVSTGEALSIHNSSGDLVHTLTSSSGVATYKGLHVGSGTTTSNQGLNVGTGASIVSDAVNTLSLYTNNSERLQIDAGGDINVGTAATIYANGNATFSGVTTAKATDLQTGPLNVGTAATISANGNATFSGIVTATSFVGSGANLTGISAGTSLSGSTNNTVCTVTGSNAIVGEANLSFDGNVLTVQGGEGYDGNIQIFADEGDDDADKWRVRALYPGNFVLDHKGTGSWATKVTSQADGDLKIEDGDLVIGTSGHGIDFAATADSSASNASMSNELLDDYEEGSWEPAASSGCSGVAHYGSHYTKIGNLCYVCAYIHQISGADSNVFKIEGLPFTADSNDSYPGSCITHGVDNTAGGAMYVNPIVEGNSDKFKMMGSGDENSWYQLTGSHVGNNDTIMIGITYRTT